MNSEFLPATWAFPGSNPQLNAYGREVSGSRPGATQPEIAGNFPSVPRFLGPRHPSRWAPRAFSSLHRLGLSALSSYFFENCDK